jgi:phenylacetate-CoA ligase
MAKHHYLNNTMYREKVGNFFPERWEDLPIITKADLQKPMSAIISRGIKTNECYVGSTSGSTGTPFFFAKDKFAHAMTWAVIANRYSGHGIDFTDKQARFYGIPRERTKLWKEQLKDKVMNRARFSVFDLSDKAMDVFLDRFRLHKFTYIYGYTSALVMFARYLLQWGHQLTSACSTLKLCISTSEVCTPEDHALLEKAFGVKHVREYGVSETCIVAFDTELNWQLNEETLLNEVVDNENNVLCCNSQGHILSTSLFNRAYPMIRYKVGDMGVLGERKDSIYRSIENLLGRTNDIVHLPGGRVAAGLTFYYVSRSILESTGILREFVIRQKELDHFVFEIVSERDLTADEIRQVQKKMDLYLQPGLKLAIIRKDSIERPKSGKLKHFYSELK